MFDRDQRVVVGTSMSPLFAYRKGDHQGSVLGPLLFNLYGADLDPVAHKRRSSLILC